MNIDRPGFETLPSDRIALGTVILETDRAALGFDEDFVAGSGFPAGEEDFFAERVFDGSRGDVRVAGRFLFSGMPLEIIPSVGGSINVLQRPSLSNCTHRRLTAKNRRCEESKKFRRRMKRNALLERRGLVGPRYARSRAR
jgi:hypothetical protein